ncbi:MAG TPA: (d)CMP kinase [Rhizomicrobium sp.]|jgi:cytidylate kinase|nr:(d)CMP kinase [Rhizomicrobium sp.]
MTPARAIVVAVDGTAASGKGTLASRLAGHFGFAHLDSGSLYRLTAVSLLREGQRANDEAAAARAASAVDPANSEKFDLGGDDIAQAASIVAAFPRVRAELLGYQRRFAAEPPAGATGAVIDGRDIGTVVCPSADVKLFVDARPQTRAHRRWLELRASGADVSEEAVLADICARDARDRSRAVAPLRPAVDAILLDTSEFDIDAAFAAALALVKPGIEEALAARRRG